MKGNGEAFRKGCMAVRSSHSWAAQSHFSRQQRHYRTLKPHYLLLGLWPDILKQILLYKTYTHLF